MRGLFGLEAVRTGRVRIGAWSGTATPNERWRQGIGFLSEDRKEEGLAAGAVHRRQPDAVAARRSRARDRWCCPGAQDRAAARWMERLEIKSRSPRQAVAELSGGNQQKVALARLLHHDVDVLLLDEPTRGIDVASKAQIYELIDALRFSSARTPSEPNAGLRSAPRAVLMISSYVPNCSASAIASRSCAADGSATPRPGRRAHRAPTDARGDRCWRRVGEATNAPRIRPGRSSAWRFVAIIFGFLVGPQFFRGNNLELIARQTAIVCTAALGMTMVIVAGGIDLSVGSIVALTTVVIALVLGADYGRCRPPLAGVGAGAVCGLISGAPHHAARASCRSSSRSG